METLKMDHDDDNELRGRRATPAERERNERELNRLKQLFPSLPRARWVDFLVEVTAFPFNSLPEAIAQAAALSRAAHKDPRRAYIESDRSMMQA